MNIQSSPVLFILGLAEEGGKYEEGIGYEAWGR
jgi:hypothetical protein